MAVTADIPLIDISGDQDAVAQQLVDAAHEHGFIYIRNLGADISPESIDGAFALVCLRSSLLNRNSYVFCSFH